MCVYVQQVFNFEQLYYFQRKQSQQHHLRYISAPTQHTAKYYSVHQRKYSHLITEEEKTTGVA
jgi:hypothetical protein